jgi:peroxiredoxin
MRAGILSAAAIALATGVMALAQDDSRSKASFARMDEPIQNFALRDVMKELKEGEKEEAALVSLDSLKEKKTVVLFFMSEGCGTTWRYEKRVGKFLKEYGDKNVVMMGVRCSAIDTLEGIKKYAEARHFDMPVLNDERGELTKFFKVRNTPSFIVIDKKGVLRYKGGYDDNAEEANVTRTYLVDAVNAVLEGKEVKTKETRALG